MMKRPLPSPARLVHSDLFCCPNSPQNNPVQSINKWTNGACVETFGNYVSWQRDLSPTDCCTSGKRISHEHACERARSTRARAMRMSTHKDGVAPAVHASHMASHMASAKSGPAA